MANYDLVFRKSVLKDLRKLPVEDIQTILGAIEALRLDPRPVQSQKLTASERYRLRIGRYRVLYEIEDARVLILIVRIAHCKDAYR